jgi:hypothetical protein
VPFPALLDTCVLYPAYLCDTLLRLAEAAAYRPLWSDAIFDELRRNLVNRGLPEQRVDRRITNMRSSFPDALVTGYESLVGPACPDSPLRYAGICDPPPRRAGGGRVGSRWKIEPDTLRV